MLSVLDYIETSCPALFADPNRDAYIARAEVEVGVCTCCGTFRNAMVAALSCHFYARNPENRAPGASLPGGQVTSLREGNVAVTMAAGGSSGWSGDDALRTTPGGMEYLRLRGMSGCGNPEWAGGPIGVI